MLFHFPALSFFLVAACLCLTESRSHFNGKINALITRLEKARDPRFEGKVQMVEYDGQCDWIGGKTYWCPLSDKCCPYPADNDLPGDWVCCDYDATGVTCANPEYEC